MEKSILELAEDTKKQIAMSPLEWLEHVNKEQEIKDEACRLVANDIN